MIYTTLRRIRVHKPCAPRWIALLKHLGKTQVDDEPLGFDEIVKAVGLRDAIWCCRAEPQHASTWRMFAVQCARRVSHLLRDPNSIKAIDTAERFALGQATENELAAAYIAAYAAYTGKHDQTTALVLPTELQTQNGMLFLFCVRNKPRSVCMIYTTLNRIQPPLLHPSSWERLLLSLGKTQADDDPLSFGEIVASNGIEDALWCCRAEPQHHKIWRLFAVWCVRQVDHLSSDPRSIAATDTEKRFALGQATEKELAADAAEAAIYTTYAATYAAEAAYYTATYVTYAAADAAYTAYDAAYAAYTAYDAAYAAYHTSREEQKTKFLELLSAT